MTPNLALAVGCARNTTKFKRPVDIAAHVSFGDSCGRNHSGIAFSRAFTAQISSISFSVFHLGKEQNPDTHITLSCAIYL